jgi:hypothetical protein
MTTKPDDLLTRKLRAWRVAPVIPARFRRGVWQRIEAREADYEGSLLAVPREREELPSAEPLAEE